MPLAGGANQIAVLAPDGRELERFPQSAGDGANGSPVPFDTPSSARFLGTRLIVANQSFTGSRENQALLDVEVGEGGLPELVPGLDRTLPRITKASLSRKRVRPRRRLRVRYRLSEAATVTFRVERRAGKAWAHVRTFTRKAKKGKRAAAFKAPRKAGRYRVRLRARDASRNRSRWAGARFRVRR